MLYRLLLRLALWQLNPGLLRWALAHQRPKRVFLGNQTPLTFLGKVFSGRLDRDFRRRRRRLKKNSLISHDLRTPSTFRQANRFGECLTLLLDSGHALNERDRSGLGFLSCTVGLRIGRYPAPASERGESDLVLHENFTEATIRKNTPESENTGEHLWLGFGYLWRYGTWSSRRRENIWVEVNTCLLEWLSRRGEVFDWQDLPLRGTDGTVMEKDEAERILPVALAMTNHWPRTRDPGVNRHVLGLGGWGLLHEACGGVFPNPQEVRRLLEEGLDWNQVGNGKTCAELVEKTCEKMPDLRMAFDAALESHALEGVLPAPEVPNCRPVHRL